VQSTWFTCPAEQLYLRPFPPSLSCEPNPVFLLTNVHIPWIGTHSLYPIQLHGLAYGVFASLVAPFGGFFASAIKRAYNKKDFDSFIPGHGMI
jgi:phosphatidate cytidylyltransferase